MNPASICARPRPIRACAASPPATFAPSVMKISVLQADYLDPVHARAVEHLLGAYARDPMGGAQALPADILGKLVGELAKRPHAFSVLAFVDEKPAGLVNCF